MNTRKYALLLTLLAGSLAAGAAQAGGPAVQWSVDLITPTIRLPGHVVLPLPPIPVPRVVVVQPSREAFYQEPRYERGPDRGYVRGYGDADRDGIPDRRDAVYNPRWDRDGDGVPNRYDARPDDPRYGRGWHEARRDWRDGRRDWRDDRREDRRDDRGDGHRGHRGD
jgi:hypothetical protein